MWSLGLRTSVRSVGQAECDGRRLKSSKGRRSRAAQKPGRKDTLVLGDAFVSPDRSNFREERFAGSQYRRYVLS